jgi:hypothetical protein
VDGAALEGGDNVLGGAVIGAQELVRDSDDNFVFLDMMNQRMG